MPAAHADPLASLLLALSVLLLIGKLGGELATRLGQPPVLGELVAGILLAAVFPRDGAFLQFMLSSDAISALAGIGALVLLFQVGVESTVGQLMRVGGTALLVATLGVVTPMALGWLAGAWLLPDAGPLVHAFLGATLSATSVGITARVLQDLGASGGPEARIILAAAVIDDVLGLLLLGAIGGAIADANAGTAFALTPLLRSAFFSTAFLAVAIVIGTTVAPRLFLALSLMQVRGVLVTMSLSLCFLLAWAATLVGLAPIVGAFAAGLILEDVHFKDFVNRGEHPLEDLLQPIADVLVPIFFVMMGLRTDLRVLASPGVLGLAAVLIVAAIAGKQVCSLGVRTPGLNRLAVGIGMIPRGEVGLIFANLGAGLMLNGVPVISSSTFAAVVAMVIVTTLITPPALKWSLSRGSTRPQ